MTLLALSHVWNMHADGTGMESFSALSCGPNLIDVWCLKLDLWPMPTCVDSLGDFDLLATQLV